MADQQQQEVGQLLHNDGLEKYVWNSGNPFGHVVVTCSIMSEMDKSSNPSLRRV